MNLNITLQLMSMAVTSRSIPLFLSVYKYVNQKVQASPFTKYEVKCYIIFQNNLPAFQLNFIAVHCTRVLIPSEKICTILLHIFPLLSVSLWYNPVLR
jgi:hypothetical protein